MKIKIQTQPGEAVITLKAEADSEARDMRRIAAASFLSVLDGLGEVLGYDPAAVSWDSWREGEKE